MFRNAGKHNTQEAVRLAVETAKKHNITHLVVASTVGDTAKSALEAIKGTDLKLVVVTHSSSFGEAGKQEFDEAIRKEIESAGHHVHTGMHLFRGLGRAIKNKVGFSDEEIVAQTLRLFGEGVKVCAEITAMAVDAGLAPYPGLVVAVAGTGRGADTVAIISTAPTHKFFEMKIKEIVTKPFDF